jgi:hypothetical protein
MHNLWTTVILPLMRSRRWAGGILALALILAAAGTRGARAQVAAWPTVGTVGPAFNTGFNYGGTPFSGIGGGYSYGAGYGIINYGAGYGIIDGQVGTGYQTAGGLYQQAYGESRPQTTVSLQPLGNVNNLTPGWGRRTRRARLRVSLRSVAPRTPPFDRDR